MLRHNVIRTRRNERTAGDCVTIAYPCFRPSKRIKAGGRGGIAPTHS
jgi:hypothetical protein